MVNLDTVLINKPGNRLSLEREIRDMAALFLLDRGFLVAGEEGGSENRNTPLAAGRVTTQGERTLSSSKIVSRMLKAAVGKAVKALPKTLKTEALP